MAVGKWMAMSSSALARAPGGEICHTLLTRPTMSLIEKGGEGLAISIESGRLDRFERLVACAIQRYAVRALCGQ